mgnify:FL=1
MDKELFLQKYEEVYRDMYRYALLTLGHSTDAEDAVSEAVLDAYRQRDSLRDIGSFRGWIFKILSRKCIGKKRDYATKKTVSLDEAPPGQGDGAPMIEELADDGFGTEESTVVKQLFMTLDDEDRRIISLHIFGGYTSREIGEMMGMNDATVRSREHRALEKLRGVMGDG